MTWTGTTTVSDWGQIRVVIEGRDVTWFRDVETKVQSWQHTDPYGPNSATIVFPQVRGYDDRDNDPDLKWLREGGKVRIYRVLDGAVVSKSDPPFNGWIDSIEDGDPTTITCSGNFNGRLSTRVHQPTITERDAVDGGWLIAKKVLHSSWIDLYPRHGLATGIQMQERGSRDMSQLGYIEQVLGLLVQEDGSSVTILPDSSKGVNGYRMQWRTMKATPDATVHYGAHGVKVALRRDLVDMVTGVWGEGVAPNGERWRNAKYPNLWPDATTPDYPFADHRTFGLGTTDADTATGDGISVMARELWGDGLLPIDENMTHTFNDDVRSAIREMQRNLGLTVDGQMSYALWQKLFNKTFDHLSFSQAHFAALAIDDRTRYYERSADGTIVGRNPNWDRNVPQVEQFIGYGDHVTKREARRNARGIVNRAAQRSGTVTLTSDPAEMSRFDLRAGMTLKVEHYLGGKKVYISSVQVDWSSATRPVTLAVSTTPRHYIDLQTLKQRRMEARQDPAKQWRHQLRRSAQTSDAIQGWEGESGAGIIRRHSLIAGRWNKVPMVACQIGTMAQLRLQTSPDTSFYAAAFADNFREGVLDRKLGDPSKWVGTGDDQETTFQANAKWLIDDERLMIEAWGDPDQPCGYWPHHHTNAKGNATSFAPTGLLRDDGSWDFATEHGIIWWAVWPTANCTITGHCKISNNDVV